MKVLNKLVVLMGLTVGAAFAVQGTEVSASASSIKVVQTKSLDKSLPYHILEGYIYDSPQLKHQIYAAKNYLNTTFYASKAVTVRKSYNVKSVYYYISNASKTVSGWTWHGNLTQVRSSQQAQSDIQAMIGIINTMSSENRGKYLSEIHDVPVKNAYANAENNNGTVPSISSITEELGNDGYYIGRFSYTEDLDELATIGQIYDLFKGRFSNLVRDSLDSLSDNFQLALQKAKENNSDEEAAADAYSAGHSFAEALSKDIATLQN